MPSHNSRTITATHTGLSLASTTCRRSATCTCSLRFSSVAPTRTGGSPCPPRAWETLRGTRTTRHRGMHATRRGYAATPRRTPPCRSPSGLRAAHSASSGSTLLSTWVTVPSTSRTMSTGRSQTRSSSRLPTGRIASRSPASTTTSRCRTGCLRATRSCGGTGTRCRPRRPSSSTSAPTSWSRPTRTPSPSRRSRRASRSSTHPSTLLSTRVRTRRLVTDVSFPTRLAQPPSWASPAGS
mmetsp:Transcript_27157/g.63422  ORF Transcript_27157/g.63422 Transcript_27157/m.63422 type:complete len:239 (+) Transcript_27157:68-784(+)